MTKRKQKPSSAPRQYGRYLITEAVVEPRKRSKKPQAVDQRYLFAEGVEANQVKPTAAPDRSAAAPSEHRTAAAAGGGPSLFQSNGNCCDKTEVDVLPVGSILRPEDIGQVVGHEYRVRPCRCRKWFCETCGPRLGFALRHRLEERLATFKSVHGLTLTLDGELFASPEAGWSYVMKNRLLARLVRELYRRGYLHSKAYFWVVEFQHGTEQAHWHLLLEATYVPYGEVVEIWSRFRPPDAAPLAEPITAENYKGQAPGFGSVRFTSQVDFKRAVYYATKYLTKFPEGGYPDWVLDRVGRMPRFNHSKGFFRRASGHDEMCFCEECRGDVESKPKGTSRKKGESGAAKPRKPGEPTSIRTRLERCGDHCSLVRVSVVQLADGSLVDGRGRFEGNLKITFREACGFFGVSPDGLSQLELNAQEATELEGFAKSHGNSEPFSW